MVTEAGLLHSCAVVAIERGKISNRSNKHEEPI
jgi:hypothetical protein